MSLEILSSQEFETALKTALESGDMNDLPKVFRRERCKTSFAVSERPDLALERFNKEVIQTLHKMIDNDKEPCLRCAVFLVAFGSSLGYCQCPWLDGITVSKDPKTWPVKAEPVKLTDLESVGT